MSAQEATTHSPDKVTREETPVTMPLIESIIDTDQFTKTLRDRRRFAKLSPDEELQLNEATRQQNSNLLALLQYRMRNPIPGLGVELSIYPGEELHQFSANKLTFSLPDILNTGRQPKVTSALHHIASAVSEATSLDVAGIVGLPDQTQDERPVEYVKRTKFEIDKVENALEDERKRTGKRIDESIELTNLKAKLAGRLLALRADHALNKTLPHIRVEYERDKKEFYSRVTIILRGEKPFSLLSLTRYPDEIGRMLDQLIEMGGGYDEVIKSRR